MSLLTCVTVLIADQLYHSISAFLTIPAFPVIFASLTSRITVFSSLLGFTLSELVGAAYTPSNLKEAGFTLSELRESGFSVNDLKSEYSLCDLREVGFSLIDF